MEGAIYTLTLLSVVLTGTAAITVNIPLTSYEVARGKDVTLPCGYTTASTKQPSLMEWSAQADQVDADEVEIIRYNGDGTIDTSPEYQGRVRVDVSPKNFNLNLLSTKLDDTKIYRCRINIPGDTGKSSDTTRLVVLVAPSKTECGIQGKAEYGQNINLTCVSREGSPPPTYTWTSFDVQNKSRVLDPKTSSLNGGILSLYNISSDTSGFFNCKSVNKIGSDTCELKLAVMPPSMNIGSTAAIVAGVAAALLVIGIIVYCCCCRRRKDKGEDYAMGVREEESHGKVLSKNADSTHADGPEEIHSSDNAYVKSSERGYDRRSDYDDRRSDYDDRRSDYNDRRSDYDDRRSDYDDRRSDYSDRRDKYTDDRRDKYTDDRRDKYTDDRRDKYTDNRRYDDERRVNDRRDRRYDDDDDRYDEPYDDRSRERPPAPSNKPARRTND